MPEVRMTYNAPDIRALVLNNANGKWTFADGGGGQIDDEFATIAPDTLCFRFGGPAHLLTKVTLKNDAGTTIATAESDGGEARVTLLAVADGTDGDNGSTATHIKYKIDNASYGDPGSLSKVEVEMLGTTRVSGQLTNGNFMIFDSPMGPLSTYIGSLQGSGKVSISLPIRVDV